MNAMAPMGRRRSRWRREKPLIGGRRPLSMSQTGLRRVQRYLLPSERPVIVTRRHWILVVEPVLSALGMMVLAILAVARIGDAAPALVDLLLLAMVAIFLRMVWRLTDWATDWFVVTDERLLQNYGIVTRKVAIMPLSKVTDMSYNVSILGRSLGYGEFVFESAGQDQALSSINFLGRSHHIFKVLSEELFGEHGIASTRKLRPSA